MTGRAKLRVLISFAVIFSFANVACFNSYRIETGELVRLQTGVEAESVPVILEGCSDGRAENPILLAQAEGDAPIEDGIDPATGCPTVNVRLSSPISLHTHDGSEYRVTPFNFTVSDTQLVAPDYDLLLSRRDLEAAEIEVFSVGKTVGLIVGITAAAVGGFLAISILAPADRGLGQ